MVNGCAGSGLRMEIVDDMIASSIRHFSVHRHLLQVVQFFWGDGFVHLEVVFGSFLEVGDEFIVGNVLVVIIEGLTTDVEVEKTFVTALDVQDQNVFDPYTRFLHQRKHPGSSFDGGVGSVQEGDVDEVVVQVVQQVVHGDVGVHLAFSFGGGVVGIEEFAVAGLSLHSSGVSSVVNVGFDVVAAEVLA